MKKCVCLIGRPNVGKSTIFNRLIKEQKSIIDDKPGITRDRIYGNVKFENKEFMLIDTGGLDSGHDDFNEDIKMQAMLAIDESDMIVFVIDGKAELTSNDYMIKDILIKSQKPVILAVNKVDNEKNEADIYKYYELGFEKIIPISAAHHKNFETLLEEITKDFPVSTNVEDDILKFCIIGRPNVGKSSLINAILNEDRAIVSNIAGTTRDAIDTKFKYNNQEFIAIDTAGMRKKGRIYEQVEKYSLIRSLKAIERSDVCVIVISAEEGIIEHDKHIISYAIDAHKAIVIVVNKWDTIKNPDQEIKVWKQKIAAEFQFVPYAKVVFLSALTKKRLHMLMPEIINAYENSTKKIKTSLLNNVISDAVALHRPPSYKNRRLKIYFVSQTGVKPIKITFQVNSKKLIHFSYERYLENKIRENFDLTGAPIIMQYKTKAND